MYTGKTLFAQIMDFLPWKTFYRLVSRYHGSSQSLHRGRLGSGSVEHGLRAGFHHHRSVPVVVSLGAVSKHQGGSQDAYAVGPAREYPQLYTCFRRQTARCQRTRYHDSGARGDLRDGPRLSRFRATLRIARSWRALRDPRQIEYQPATGLLGAERSSTRDYLRSDGGVVGVLQSQTLSPPSASDSLQRSRDEENIHLSDQPVWSSTADHLRAVQRPLAGRVVFQMDQATSPYQEVFRHIRERRESTNLDRRVGVCARGDHQKAPRPGCFSLHFATGVFSHPFREKPFKQGLF